MSKYPKAPVMSLNYCQTLKTDTWSPKSCPFTIHGPNSGVLLSRSRCSQLRRRIDLQLHDVASHLQLHDEGDTWEPEDPLKEVSESTTSLTSEGPRSFRSLSGKGDEGGSGAGSLSRLSRLGRAARRQLAVVLDEFWGQLYDFHGNVIQESKARKLDLLLASDSKAASFASSNSCTSSLLKDDTNAKEISGNYPYVGGRGSDPLVNSSLYDSANQQRLQNSLESSYGAQRGSSSLWSGHMQLLDAYVQNSGRSLN